MRRTREIENAEREILLEGLEDHIGLWEICFDVRGELAETNGTTVRRAVMDIVSRVLSEGLMRPGFPRKGVFEEINESPDETIERIERKWDELGRDPDVGDIIWFDLTEKGEAYARSLGPETGD